MCLNKFRGLVQAVLQQLDRPLLCSSIRPLDVLSGALDDGAVLLDQYAPRGLDFVVDNGVRYGEGSSVVDMTVRTLLGLRAPCLPWASAHSSCYADLHGASVERCICGVGEPATGAAMRCWRREHV